MGVEQNNPIFTPFTPNRALSAATAMSQVATSWQPAAAASPCTSAMTGWGRRWRLCIIAAQRSNRSPKAAAPPSSALRAAVISFRSWPAQKARPAPLMTTTRIWESSASRAISALSAASMASDSGLSLSG